MRETVTMSQHKFPLLSPNEATDSAKKLALHSGTSTPLGQHPKKLRPYIHALMAFKHGRKFHTNPSLHRRRALSELAEEEGPFAPALTVSYNSSIA